MSRRHQHPRAVLAALAALAATLIASPLPAVAQNGAASDEPPPMEPIPAVPEPPELPKQVQSGEALEPEVSIRRRGKETITEYRVNGILRAVKVETEGFPAYFLVDTNGDGKVDTRQNGLNENMLIPQWVLFRW